MASHKFKAALSALAICLAIAALARAEIVQRGNVRVSFEGQLTPHSLPRSGSAPVRVSVGTKVASTNGSAPPQLRRISIAINREGHFEPQGLPVCPLREIQPTTTADALAACRGSLVGEGHFTASVQLAQHTPFPSQGKLYAFNSTIRGRPAILAHVYGTDPVPTSYTIPFIMSAAKGTFATVLSASFPQVTGKSGYITGLRLTLGRTYTIHGHRHSYLSASCPAPRGIPRASFPLAKASVFFAKGKPVSSVLRRACTALG
jgi:hypothetical protein